ncbi:nuclear transport factor 2 family protein [Enterobacter huaxiensis]|uniref:Nuclear transport factor 2 family protein n=1 Tax=Enterobacter huaxiensis TaxID=2494702 RepID=A0A3R9W3H5_9ENTR|nr:nuclear transport factor 2 family protein [Enterobacter huaxiensis]MEB7541571.1 nuclear transport factor 2 family protein [Enterobacter huaxiensis]MEB7580466.1 nuclear transport factor 2 family protein [Enterobacter huaxiensis]MEB7661336.1 nuclear transport factor 2 family protein [Enterobacter huaxiensis]RSK69176.1 nuclear transport factor 2 family protein [Enterobacter huaxiensis]
MHSQQNDRQQLADLMTGWIHRDLSEWQQLRELFHPDGTIEITWFEGLASEFVEGSMRMGASDLRTKHVIASPVVTFDAGGTKAILETNAIIIAENVKLNIGCECHNRFYDLAEKRDGVWRLFHRQSIYDMGTFTFPTGPVEVDQSIVAKYPREYAALAYLLEQSGFPLGRVFATRGSELEAKMKDEAQRWLSA